MKLGAQITALKGLREDLPLAEEAELCCQLAKQLEKGGEYELAREALDHFWPTIGEPPNLEGLRPETRARVLLRAGSLIGWLGSAQQAEGSQENAKDLISKSLKLFEDLNYIEGVAEAYADLAICYWREGAFDEARITLETALTHLTVDNPELKAVILIRSGMIEIAAHHLNEAWRIFNESSELVQGIADDAIKGTFHNLFAVLLRRLARAENREDYLDRALIEYAAASFHFEQAGHIRYQGCVDINLAFLFFSLHRYAEAHQHLDGAKDVFIALDDRVHLAQVNDTRARVLLAEGHIREAEQFSRSAKHTLERGDEKALLVEALITHAVALARIGRTTSARRQLTKAVEIAETVGDVEAAGRAQLTLIEELGDQISLPELIGIYQSARSQLNDSDDPTSRNRLISSTDVLFAAVPEAKIEGPPSQDSGWEGFSLKRHLLASERQVIRDALRDAGGSVTRAARLLGFRHHQSLISLINSRHKELLVNRSAIRKRRQHIALKPRRGRRRVPKPPSTRTESEVVILLVAQDEALSKSLAATLSARNWLVDVCSDADSALRKLTGNDNYNALITENALTGLSGLELAERVRTITHRRRIPLLMLSDDDIEKAAWRAGANEVLKKVKSKDRIVGTIERLLAALQE